MVLVETLWAVVRRIDPKETGSATSCSFELAMHLDEVFVETNGETHYLWRAVDHEGEVLESYVTKRRDRKAALKFLRKTMKRFGPPHVIVTDLLRSYGAAMKFIGNSDRQETGRRSNNRAENFHLPFRRRESHAALPPNAKFAEVHLCTCLGLQSLRSGTSPLFTRNFQAQPRGCSR